MYILLLHKAFHAWRHDHVQRLAASLSYYTLFSLAPLFLIVISITSIFFGETQVKDHIMSQVSALIGPDGSAAIGGLIQKGPPLTHNIVASTIGMVAIFFGATGVFGQLKSSLDTIWGVPVKKERSFWALVEHNFLPFTMVLGTGFLLLVSLILSAIITAISRYFGGLIPFPFLVLEGLNFVISIGSITILFAFIFKTLPDVSIKWSDVWSGAVVAALLLTIGKFIIGFYIGNSNILTAYGAAGSIIVILLWVYYAAQILFFGAEFTKVYTQIYGSQKTKSEVGSTALLIGSFIDGVVKRLKKEFPIKN